MGDARCVLTSLHFIEHPKLDKVSGWDLHKREGGALIGLEELVNSKPEAGEKESYLTQALPIATTWGLRITYKLTFM